MGENFQINYQGERYICATNTNYPRCGDKQEITIPDELTFLNSFVLAIKQFCRDKIENSPEVTLYVIPENTPLAIIIRPSDISNIGAETQQVIRIVCDIIVPEKQAAMDGLTAYGYAAFKLALQSAKNRLGFQYTATMTLNPPEGISVALEIRKKL